MNEAIIYGVGAEGMDTYDSINDIPPQLFTECIVAIDNIQTDDGSIAPPANVITQILT